MHTNLLPLIDGSIKSILKHRGQNFIFLLCQIIKIFILFIKLSNFNIFLFLLFIFIKFYLFIKIIHQYKINEDLTNLGKKLMSG